ncbi:RNA polymerase sigma factor [Larkinella soli]|uniref:RNA polymerase sigma factor n=1 Tax=Larkinella soli TaxID=1770527 RepID=UPI0013E321FC|nr:sigma-70 family RNA polymerase sigma factor [Larkinella soli]
MATDAENPCRHFDQDAQELYRALLADQQRAWECLYLKAYRVFVPYACRRSSISTDDALDILQEGLVDFSVKLKTGRYVFQGKAVTAYLFTVCRNRWISFLKKNNLRKVELNAETTADEEDLFGSGPEDERTFRFADDFGEAPATDDDPPAGPASDRDPIWEESEVDWEAVGRAFREVGEDCRTMLHCFYVEEKSLGECGGRIGLQENSAKVKRFRCAQRMKALYTQYKRD